MNPTNWKLISLTTLPKDKEQKPNSESPTPETTAKEISPEKENLPIPTEPPTKETSKPTNSKEKESTPTGTEPKSPETSMTELFLMELSPTPTEKFTKEKSNLID